jgi:hypothetical protein
MSPGMQSPEIASMNRKRVEKAFGIFMSSLSYIKKSYAIDNKMLV